MNKIIDEGVLYEDKDNEEGQDDFDWLINESEAEMVEEIIHARSAEGSDEEGQLVSEEEVSEGNVFIPRVKLQAYMMNEGVNLRLKRNNDNKFTKGTDPRIRDLLYFMGDEAVGCP